MAGGEADGTLAAEDVSDRELLRKYTEQGSEAAFARLVRRHLDLVYATCRREAGDQELAQDVAQVVFLILAKKAPTLKAQHSLAGWLFQTARFAAANACRQESLRLHCEQKVAEMTQHQQVKAAAGEFWENVESHLNVALSQLGALDREAVLLRFFEERSFAEIGVALGLSENTARMRVSRALEKLRRHLSRLGVALTAAALAALLAEKSSEAVPIAVLTGATRLAPMPGVVSPASGADGSHIYHLTQGTLKAMFVKTAAAASAITAALVVAITLPLVAASSLARKHSAQMRVSHVSHLSHTHTPRQAVQSRLTRQLSNLRLRNDFTLVYRVTVRDRRTAEILARDGDSKPNPVEQFTNTLSSHAGKLLYLSTSGVRNHRENTTSAFLLDTDREYEAGARDAGMINADGPDNGGTYRDENVDRLPYCPLPGVGLPGMDLIQSPVLAAKAADGRARFTGRVPRINIVGEEPYKVGWIEAVSSQGHLKILSLVVGPQSVPRQTWNFTEFRLFQGQWIGSAMEAATYYKAIPVADGRTAALPSFTFSYQLLEARETSLDAHAFEIGTYFSKGASICDTADGMTFAFDPQAGTLKEQAERARIAHRSARS